jgi:hypothetical protein
MVAEEVSLDADLTDGRQPNREAKTFLFKKTNLIPFAN